MLAQIQTTIGRLLVFPATTPDPDSDSDFSDVTPRCETDACQSGREGLGELLGWLAVASTASLIFSLILLAIQAKNGNARKGNIIWAAVSLFCFSAAFSIGALTGTSKSIFDTFLPG